MNKRALGKALLLLPFLPLATAVFWIVFGLSMVAEAAVDARRAWKERP